MWTCRRPWSARPGADPTPQPEIWTLSSPIQREGANGPRCQFLFKDGKSLALFSMELGAGFLDEYRNEGCSVRGGKAEVMAEVEEQLQEQANCWGLVMQTG